MTDEMTDQARLTFAHNVIEHLGVKLYKNKTGNVLAELLANCWDADASWVEIEIKKDGGDNQNGSILISDNGSGMSFPVIKDHYLHVGKPKRRSPKETSNGGRKPMGRKGLGKLAPFGIARVVDVATIAEGKLNWFTMNLDAILSSGEKGSYSPIFHAQDHDVSKPLPGSDGYVSKEVGAFLERLSNSEDDTGTLICLTSIEANQLPDDAAVAEELGGRFTVILLLDNFKVSVNGTRITDADALPAFEFRIPDGGGSTSEFVNGKSVTFWVGFVDKAEWSSDQAGVGVFAHGKIAQTRPFFFGSKGKEVFQRYLYAVVEADWIDEVDSDLISTDRTSIDWNNPELASLYEWGRRKVPSWISSYEKHRRAKQDIEVANQADELRKLGRVNTYSKSENDQIASLVSEATRDIGKTKAAQKAREELLVAVSQAWINQPMRRLLGDLWSDLLDKSATPEMLTQIVEKLSENSVPEAMGLAMTFAQRAYAISVLYKLVHERSETNLQKLVTTFPWILQPRGDLLTHDQWLKTTVDKAAKALGDGTRVGSTIKGMSEKERADFVFLTDTQHKSIEVVEIKGPDLVLTVEEERQLMDYIQFLGTTNPSANITGVLIGNTGQGFKSDNTRVSVKSWDQIFEECRAAYVDMVASMIEISDIAKGDSRIEVIKDVGGEATWELLEKIAEKDEELKLLMNSVGSATSTWP